MLLMRDCGDGMVTRFEVLQSECRSANVRETRDLDISSTRYCAINSRAALTLVDAGALDDGEASE